MRYKGILEKKFKTEDPTTYICCVFDFPYLNTKKEDVAKYYLFDEKKDPIFYELLGFITIIDGSYISPFAFVDNPEEYEKKTGYISGELNGNDRGWWVYCYKTKYRVETTPHTSIITYPDIETLEKWIDYLLKNKPEWTRYFNILFNLLIKEIIYDRTKNFDEDQKLRRFKLIENLENTYNRYGEKKEEFITSKEYLKIIDIAKNENIYKVMFDFYS